MFEKFKQSMPTNKALCSRVIDRVLTNKTSNEIKKDFSSLLLKIHNDIYEEYLHEQNRSGHSIKLLSLKTRSTLPLHRYHVYNTWKVISKRYCILLQSIVLWQR